ncbi:MAG: STAS domain-containing protein [Acidimicrobiia bacterium]
MHARPTTFEGIMNTAAESPHDGDLDLRIEGHTLHVRGEIDAHSAPELGTALRTTTGDVEIDLSGVDFVDSSGLRVLIETHQLLEGRGDVLTLAHPSPAVLRMFELSAVDGYLNIRRS